MTSAQPKPMPMPRPSSVAAPTGFFDANASARPRNPHARRNDVARKRDDDVGADEDERRRDGHADGVAHRRADRQRRAKAEQHPTIGTILVGEEFSTKKWKNDWGYHLIRSKYAVGSGGAKGQGFRRGPFVKYDFLPERYNDFIFAAIAHQWGFWGCMALLGLFVVVVWCGLEIAANNTDPFGRLLAVGIIAMFTVEIIINVSMTVGLMPITGLTLPLVSYGGSSLLVSMISVGLLNNIGRCRPFSVAPKAFE